MFKLLSVAAVFASFSAHASVSIEKVFIPHGFDDNDNVQIVVSATLPNTCWKLTNTKTDRQGFLINVDLIAEERFNGVCLPFQVPFHKVIDLGTLKSGEYTIQAGNPKMLHALQVGKSTSSGRDERLYGNITSGYVTGNTLTLKGLHPDSTFYIKEVHISRTEDVIEVLPIAETTGNIGVFVTFPFETTVDLSKFIKTGETYLIHVRSMNGTSVNLVESF